MMCQISLREHAAIVQMVRRTSTPQSTSIKLLIVSVGRYLGASKEVSVPKDPQMVLHFTL